MAAARSRRADSTDSSSQAAASGSASARMPPLAWARRIRSARCPATARAAFRAGVGQRGVGGQRRRVGEQHAVPGTCVLSARVPGIVTRRVMARPPVRGPGGCAA